MARESPSPRAAGIALAARRPDGPRAAPEEGPSPAARAAAHGGLYVHVPFCARRCRYCDFASGVLAPGAAERWLAGIEIESRRRAGAAAELVFHSVFLGGGTPSVLAPEQVPRLFAALRGSFAVAPDAEITLEANPESVDAPRLAAWRAAGVNRLSLGAQSFHADELARLGRLHSAERPGAALAQARAHGFARVSLDLMYAFPGHTLARWRATLERALALEPEHLSAYAFTPESGTPLGDEVLTGRAALPADDEQAEMYGALVERAAGAGLASYETSNLCRAGAEARHNLVYWLRRPYVGLGPSAHGFVGGERYGNLRDTVAWCDALEAGRLPEAEREPGSAASRAREILLLGLRLATGVRAGDYPRADWAEVLARYGGALAEAVATGRLAAAADGFAVPRALRFVADDALAWIEARAEARGFDRDSAHSVPSRPCPNPPSSGAGAAPTRT